MTYFKEEIDYTGFFPMPRNLFQHEDLKDSCPVGLWAELSLTAKSILPVILAHMFNESCCPGIRQIAALSGTSKSTVTRGVEDLKTLPDFTVRKTLTRQGRFQNIYSFKRPNMNERNSWFPFHRCIIQGGNWALLSASAKAVYLTMRYWAEYDSLSEQIEFEGGGECIDFSNRKFDTCRAQRNTLAQCAGISTRSVSNALKDLAKHGLIQRALEIEDYGEYFEPADDVWCVYLRPLHHYKSAWLNQKSEARLGKKR